MKRHLLAKHSPTVTDKSSYTSEGSGPCSVIHCAKQDTKQKAFVSITSAWSIFLAVAGNTTLLFSFDFSAERPICYAGFWNRACSAAEQEESRIAFLFLASSLRLCRLIYSISVPSIPSLLMSCQSWVAWSNAWVSHHCGSRCFSS